MKKDFLLLTFAASVFFTTAASAQHQLVQKWATDSVLKTPESVLYDGVHHVLFESNIDGAADAKDGKGSIGKIGLDGKVINVDWVTGLNAPKGMALVGTNLWVADIDQLVQIDIIKGEITKRVKIPGAKFLNDLAAAPDGSLYVSDSKTLMIHLVKDGESSVFLKDLQAPNGVLVVDNQLFLLDKGGLYKVGPGKKLIKIADGMDGNTDGLEHVGGNDFLASLWEGAIFYVKGNGTTEKLLDTRDQKINSADIGYDPKHKVIYVPTFLKNSVVAYQLK